MTIPPNEQLKLPTLEYLERGVHHTDEIRRLLAIDFKLTKSDLSKRHPRGSPIFINNHAHALKYLKKNGDIVRIRAKFYDITDKGCRNIHGTVSRVPQSVFPPIIGDMPKWARQMISRAKSENGPDGPRFSEHDLMELWSRCGGRCEITGLRFSERKVGSGKAKRAFAPSLDKIDPDGYYTLDNTRLVMVAINFALNSWGKEVYLELAKAAVRLDENKER